MGYLRQRISPSGANTPTLRSTYRCGPDTGWRTFWYANLLCDVCFREEAITDYVGGGRNSYNPVWHRKLRYSLPSGRRTMTGTSGAYLTHYPYLVPGQVRLANIGGYLDQRMNKAYGFGTSDFQAFANDAFYDMTTLMKQRYDVFNVVKDIVDLHSLLKQCVGLIKKAVALLNKIFSLLKRGYQWRTASSIRHVLGALKETSNGYLLNQFGIMPVIGEIREVIAGISSGFNRLQEIQRMCDRVLPAHIVRHRTESIPNFQFANGVINQALGGGMVWAENIVSQTLYVASAHFYLDPDLQDLIKGAYGHFASLFDTFGIGHLSEFAWDLVPFSFVANWFVGIDKWLRNNLSVDALGNIVHIQRGGMSVKRHITCNLVYVDPYNPKVNLGKVSYSLYERRPGLQVDRSVFCSVPDLNSDQLAVLTALVFQRV